MNMVATQCSRMIASCGMAVRKDIKQISNKMRQQASRFKPPPRKLANLLTLVNLVHSEHEPAELLGVKSVEVEEKLKQLGNDAGWSGRFKILLEAAMQEQPLSFNEYVYQTDSIQEAVQRYEQVRITREIFKEIARVANNPSAEKVIRHPYRVLPYLMIDADGLHQPPKDELIEILRDVEAARIRECESCRRIFWAGRITQRGCSARCGDIIRKRRHRERYRQGFYQGAKPTPKEQKESQARRKAPTKKGR